MIKFYKQEVVTTQNVKPILHSEWRKFGKFWTKKRPGAKKRPAVSVTSS